MMIKIRNDKNFKGNIKEFIALCEHWLNTFVIGKKGFIPNERLVRGYVTEETLPRPDRKGKESIYGYNHLIYFLACRDLFSENWPLAKIGEHFRSISFEEIELSFLKKYDQISAFQNFFINPLTLLAGVFFSTSNLPDPWRTLSLFNPFFYLIDGFRFGIFGVSDVSPWLSLVICNVSAVSVSLICIYLIATGWKLKY